MSDKRDRHDLLRATLKQYGEVNLGKVLSKMHPADLGKIVRAIARAYDERYGLQHPDMEKSIDFLRDTHAQKRS